MGTVAPLPFASLELMSQIEREIVAPTLKAMQAEGILYEGVLYPGLILTKDGPKILEYNARFGDPETQTYMRLLDSDLLDIVNACVDKKLSEIEVHWKNISACNIVLASFGYPGNYEKGKIISGIKEAEEKSGIVVFQAGTKYDARQNLVTNGGRVLGISATGQDLPEALKNAYEAVKKVSFDGKYYREDIGQKALAVKK
jgi:phosphoribosylamine--glycine ligase